MIHRPSWFNDDEVMVSIAPTYGLTKGGRLLPLVDRTTGLRVQEPDPETGELIDAIDDQLKIDMEALRDGVSTLPRFATARMTACRVRRRCICAAIGTTFELAQFVRMYRLRGPANCSPGDFYYLSWSRHARAWL